MAQKFYSPGTGGFYIEGVSPVLPPDAVAITEVLYQSLLGKQVVAGSDGNPMETPAPVESLVPASVTMRQARLALLSADRLGMVELAIAGLPSPQREAAQIEWEFAATVDRASPLLAMLVGGIGVTEEELDQLFMLAATL